MPTTSPVCIQAGIPAVAFDVPAGTDILTVPPPAPPLGDPTSAIAQALITPRGTPPLAQVVAAASPGKVPAHKTVVIVVSDVTRLDVPYTGPASILHPVLRTLEAQSLLPEHLTILVATGTHRASTSAEKITMFGADVLQRYPIVDHSATDTTTLRLVACTVSGTNVYINTRVKILTSEIKPHFVAGFSGGRKAICPGLANLATLQKFHSPQFLAHPCATNVLLEGNPCHQEATDVAERVGADFLINVTISHG